MPKNLPPAIATLDADAAPSLYRDPSFWGMTVTQFLGAFNDNLFKQLVLLLSIAAAGAGAAAAPKPTDNQGLAMFIFAAPFLAFTGFAGYLADRFSKRNIVVVCKFAEIGIMALGGVGVLPLRTGSRHRGIPVRRAVPHGHAQRVLRPGQVRHPARDAARRAICRGPTASC